jgi:hypothetical protein
VPPREPAAIAGGNPSSNRRKSLAWARQTSGNSWRGGARPAASPREPAAAFTDSVALLEGSARERASGAPMDRRRSPLHPALPSPGPPAPRSPPLPLSLVSRGAVTGRFMAPRGRRPAALSPRSDTQAPKERHPVPHGATPSVLFPAPTQGGRRRFHAARPLAARRGRQGIAGRGTGGGGGPSSQACVRRGRGVTEAPGAQGEERVTHATCSRTHATRSCSCGSLILLCFTHPPVAHSSSRVVGREAP